MSKRKFYVLVKLADPEEDHYGFKIESFRRIDSVPENAVSCKPYEGCVANYEFGDLNRDIDYSKMSDKEIEKETKYLVSADEYYRIPGDKNSLVLEFDEDSYGKFIFVTKMDKSAYFSAE